MNDYFWTNFIYTFFVVFMSKAFAYADGRDDQEKGIAPRRTQGGKSRSATHKMKKAIHGVQPLDISTDKV